MRNRIVNTRQNKIPNKTIVPTPNKSRTIVINNKQRVRKNLPSTSKSKGGVHVVRNLSTPRPKKYLTSIANKTIRINFPEEGSFNAGIVAHPTQDKYICVYRPNEHSFVGCFLDKDYKPEANSYFRFKHSNCADPRLIWTPDGKKLLMIYSSIDEVGLRYECIRGAVIMDLDKSEDFVNSDFFRVSPPDMKIRQKNWMPFLCDDKIFLIASVCPHIIYELHLGDSPYAEKVSEVEWGHPWMYSEALRGNTNAVLLEDGNYLATFHTAAWHNDCCHYDNGAYIFEGKAPFRVLKCANRSYMPAEDAVHPHFRKAGIIKCTFPVGMIREGNKIIISYGDNDSIVKILETTVEEMQSLMLDVY